LHNLAIQSPKKKMNVNIQNDEKQKIKICWFKQNMVFVASSSTQCVPPWEHEVPMNGKKVVEYVQIS
jgi:hypothetical protein